MTIYDLKPKFQDLLRPIVIKLNNKSITPNQVTLVAMVLSILFGLIIMFSNGNRFILFLTPFFMFLRMAMNAVDGMLAKEHNLKTKKGAVFNEMSDVIADSALFLPFAFVVGFNPILIILFTILGIFNEMAGVVNQTITGNRRYDGPMGKSDRVFVIGFISFLLGIGFAVGNWINIIIIIAIILSIYSTYKRATRGY